MVGLTVAAGFVGGEIIPTLIIGAVAGSASTALLPGPILLLSVSGALGLLSARTKLPLVCTFLGIELFGLHNGFFFLSVCLLACAVSGKKGMYESQAL